MSESKKVTKEIDNSTTLSGLPAPEGWSVADRISDEEGLYFRKWVRLTGERISVIESVAVKDDGHTWLHVSVAKPKPSKFPTWDDLQTAANLFIGDRECYLIRPTKDRYVNFFDVLHWYTRLDAPDGVLPHMEGRLTWSMVNSLDVPPELRDKIKPGELSV